METTRMIIRRLAKSYLCDEDYHQGIISGKWVRIVKEELYLEELNDLELANMWDMVFLTLQHEIEKCDANKDYTKAWRYQDVCSAFTEVVNQEARQRRER